MQPDELDLVPVDELKAAILRRHDTVIIAGLDEGPDDQVSWAWQGDRHKVVGLLEELKARVFAHREAQR
jgi:hypothetical protein